MFHLLTTTFNFHEGIMALAEAFCREWEERREPFKSSLESALVLNFALCAIKRDLEQRLDQLERRSVFQGVSPREVYERGGYDAQLLKGLSGRDVVEIVEKSWDASVATDKACQGC